MHPNFRKMLHHYLPILRHCYLPVTFNEREVFWISKGGKDISLPMDSICYFFQRDEINYVRTIDGENYFVDQTLDEGERQVCGTRFFRVNRQMIVHDKFCESFEQGSYGKLLLYTKLSFEEEITINKTKTRPFRIAHTILCHLI